MLKPLDREDSDIIKLQFLMNRVNILNEEIA